MRSHAKAASAGSIEGGGESRGLLRRAFATRAVLEGGKGLGASSPGRRGTSLAVVALTLMALVLTAAPAFAVEATSTYTPTGTFATGGSGPGGSGSEPGQLTNPTHIAVEPATGNVLVADSGNDRIQVFAPGGGGLPTYLTSFGSSAFATPPTGLAIDQSTGSIYVSAATLFEIQKVTLTDAADGSFTLSLEGQTTAPLAFTSEGDELPRAPSAAAVQEALEDLSTLGADRVRVGKSGNTYSVFFKETPAGLDLDEMTADGSGLEAGEAGPASVSVQTSQNGLAGELLRFTSDGAPTPTYTEDATFTSPAQGSGPDEIGSFASPIAIDPISHDILIADAGNLRVDRFTSAGAVVPAFNGAASQDGSLINPADIAVGATGTVFVVDALGHDPNGIGIEDDILIGGSEVKRFTNVGAADGTLPDIVGPSSVTLDPTTGNILVAGDQTVAGRTHALYRYTGAGTPIDGPAAMDPANDGFPASNPGLAVGDGGQRVYVVDARNNEGFNGIVGIQIMVSASIPGTEIGVTTEVGATTAKLSGVVATGAQDATVHFEYCLDENGLCVFYAPADSSDPGNPWVRLPDQSVIGGTGETVVSNELTGLRSSSKYLVRLHAENTTYPAFSTNSVGGAFTTEAIPPLISDVAAGNVTATSATFNGKIVPYGLQTSYYFEYGETSAYGQRLPASYEGVVGNSFGPRAVTEPIFNLKPATGYHFRLVAVNVLGTVRGEDQTFTTRSATSAGSCPNNTIREIQQVSFLPDCRAYEQVSPIEKSGVPFNQLGLPSYLRQDGSGIAYSTNKAAYPGSESNPLAPKTLSLRSATQWTTKGIDPPLSATTPGSNLYYATAAVSKDLTRALVTTTRKLAPEAVEGDWNIYIRETGTDNYTYIGEGNLYNTTGPGHFFGTSDDLRTVVVEGKVWHEGTPGLNPLGVRNDGTLMANVGSAINKNHFDVNQVSADGSHIYFEVTGGPEAGLYLREDNAKTVLISRSQRPGDPSTPVPASFAFASPDGRYVTFETVQSVPPLTPDAPEGIHGARAYLYDVESDTLSFIADDLAPNGEALAKGNLETNDLYVRDPSYENYFYAHNGTLTPVGSGEQGDFTMMSPNGKYFAFDDFLYDAVTDTLSCPNCRSDGGPRLGDAHWGAVEPDVMGRHGPTAILDDGTFFFDTPNPLVRADTNGTRDVYSYNHGDLELLTSGRQSVDAEFVNVTADGRNMFFTTTARLVGQDKDTVQDLYVARVDGGLPLQNPDPPIECLRDDCKATPNAGPELPFGGSEGLTGPGNVKPAVKKRCGKGRHKVKARGKTSCVKQHKNRAKNDRRRTR